MKWITKPRVKYALAGVGVFYLLLFAGYLVYAGLNRKPPAAASDLEAHPERQAEIIAQRRVDEMKDQLKLTDDQVQKVTELFSKQSFDPDEEGGGRERRRAMREELAKLLTPEQQALLDQMRGPGGPGGPGGRGGPMSRLTPERIESIKSGMTPEQQARFEKKIQDWQQRRQQGRDGRRNNPGPPQR